MDQKTIDMMGKIMDTERMGYAYVYPSDGSAREEYLIATTPENMANFVGSRFLSAQKMVITDIADRLILDTCGGFIDTCPDQKLCMEINSHLVPIQLGEKEAGDILQLDRKQADAYFAAEDRAVAMAEYGMECGMGSAATWNTWRKRAWTSRRSAVWGMRNRAAISHSFYTG